MNLPDSPRYVSQAAEYLKGRTIDVGADGSGGVTIDGTYYRGGYWHGPLTAAQITAITNAGYGARIYSATDVAYLPSEIDSG